MEKKPFLTFHPEIVMTVLTANADTMEKYTDYRDDGYEDRVGAGYNNPASSLSNIDNEIHFTYNILNTSNIVVSTKNIYIPAGKTIKISFASLVNTQGENVTNKVTDYDLELYDSNGVLVARRSSLSNTEIVSFTTSVAGTYSIRIYLCSPKSTEWIDHCSYAYKIS